LRAGDAPRAGLKIVRAHQGPPRGSSYCPTRGGARGTSFGPVASERSDVAPLEELAGVASVESCSSALGLGGRGRTLLPNELARVAPFRRAMSARQFIVGRWQEPFAGICRIRVSIQACHLARNGRDHLAIHQRPCKLPINGLDGERSTGKALAQLLELRSAANNTTDCARLSSSVRGPDATGRVPHTHAGGSAVLWFRSINRTRDIQISIAIASTRSTRVAGRQRDSQLKQCRAPNRIASASQPRCQ
jgi:hypothetical protein